MPAQTKVAAAGNDATNWLGVAAHALYSISVGGTLAGCTIGLQRSFDGGTTPLTIEAYTAATEKNGEAAEDQVVRLICSTYVGGQSPAMRVSTP